MRATVANADRHVNVVLPDNLSLAEGVERLKFLAESMGNSAKVTMHWADRDYVYRVENGRMTLMEPETA